MGWLIRFEAYPRWFDDTLRGYQDVVQDLPQLMDSWMRVVADGEHVGYSHSNVDRTSREGRDYIEMKSLFFLRVDTGTSVETLRLSSTVLLDDRQDLREFEFGGSFMKMGGHVKGIHLEGTDFELSFFVQDQELRKAKLSIPPDALLSGATMEGGFQNVAVGETIRVQMQDPLLGQLREVVLKGIQTELLQLDSMEEPVEAKLVQMESQGLVLNAWLDDKGRMLRQELPFGGLMLEASDSADAIRVSQSRGLNLQRLLQSNKDSNPSMLNLIQTITP